MPGAYPDLLLGGVGVGEGSEGPTVSRSSGKGKRPLLKLGTSGGRGCQTRSRCRSSISSTPAFQTAPSGWDAADTVSKGQRAHRTLLIHTTCARETQHMRGLVIGGTPRKAGTVSQRLCFRRDWSPQNSKDFWWREGQGGSGTG